MNIHMRKHLSDPVDGDLETPYPCSECNRWLPSEAALLAHQRQHSLTLILKCKVCKKEFSDRDELAEHESEHSTKNEKQDLEEIEFYTCELCPTEFALRSHLKAHVLMQHNERTKKFSCPKCQKSYSIK